MIADDPPIDRALPAAVADANRARRAATSADALHALRSAAAHLGHVPSPPNATDRAPDDADADAERASLVAVIDAALDRPDRRLVVYGTLRPGRENHHLLADLGTFEPATVTGAVGWVDGYPVLTVLPATQGGTVVDADLLRSTRLPAHWDELDRFEGPGYRRDLVLVALDGGVVVANCYVSADAEA